MLIDLFSIKSLINLHGKHSRQLALVRKEQKIILALFSHQAIFFQQFMVMIEANVPHTKSSGKKRMHQTRNPVA